MLLAVIAAGCVPTPAPPPDSISDAKAKLKVSPSVVPTDASVQVTERVSYVLLDGEQQHEEFPDSFWIPPAEQRRNLQKDQIVKLMFQITVADETETERMWVVVQKNTTEGYVGTLDNDPYCTDEMKAGLEVHFQPRHVIQIYDDDESPDTK
ncbi:MAG: DUF2314 domain-containing protein [Planctomycetaceae bacterium]|nr:DUF2314 domain-containing protein [Planctomycetaceae bacterium]MBT6153211.1 DUF2314 domain-containing protein [Planctomycetaceae bacterium]MBT6484595.1 DUF2314 domain-containing protein [Planctomycetaceae bacterium]MBT6493313.1 DUF2314 domain-containing protein [Planctomycetaceae bacterium]